MNKVSSVLIIFLIGVFSIFSVSAAPSGIEFTFEFIIENEFSDDEEIECVVDYDDKDTDFTLKEGDEVYDYDQDIEEDMELDCSKALDKITFVVKDSNDIIMFQKIYLNAFGVKYKVDTVDETKPYFEIDLKEHDFDLTGKIDCDLDIDEYSYEYSFDDDTDNKDLIVSRNYDEEIIFDCDDQFEEIKFKVFDGNGNQDFSETYKNENNFEYNLKGSSKNYFEIEITHDFAANEEIDCDLKIDDEETEDYTFDEDSDKDDFDIEKNFIEDIEFDCNSELDTIELTVYDSNFKLIDVIKYEDEDKFEYQFNQGDYEFFLEIKHVFKDNDEIDCDLDIDDDDRIEYTFDKSSSLSKLRIEDAFEKEFQFDCDDDMDEFYLLVFEDDERSNKDIQVFEKSYKNTDRFTFNTNEIVKSQIEVEDKKEEKEDEIIIEEPVVEEKDEPKVDKNPILLNPPINESENKNDLNKSITDKSTQEEATDITWIVVTAGVGIGIVFGIAAVMLFL